MTGVVDVGGGLRGIFGAGVFDYCIEQGIRFDYCIGVSAGAANICSLQGRQKGRNYVYYMEYSKRPEYMSFRNLIRTRNYIDLDYIYGTLSNEGGEYPLNFAGMLGDAAPLKVVATNALTGEPYYFDKNRDMSQDHYEAISASCCVPVINRPYMIGGVPYYDGGISDSVPFEKAFAEGCDKVVLILTKTRDFVRDPAADRRVARYLMGNRYPAARKALENRAALYNDAIKRAFALEKEGRLLVIAPAKTGRLKTLTKDYATLEDLYRQGYAQGKLLEDFV